MDIELARARLELAALSPEFGHVRECVGLICRGDFVVQHYAPGLPVVMRGIAADWHVPGDGDLRAPNRALVELLDEGATWSVRERDAEIDLAVWDRILAGTIDVQLAGRRRLRLATAEQFACFGELLSGDGLAQPIDVVLGPGDAVFLPLGWWVEEAALSASVGARSELLQLGGPRLAAEGGEGPLAAPLCELTGSPTCLALGDAEALIYVERTERTYRLNRVAAFVACCLEERMSIEQATVALSDCFGVSLPAAAEDVGRLLVALRSAQFSAPAPVPVVYPRLRAGLLDPAAGVRCVRVLGDVVALRGPEVVLAHAAAAWPLHVADSPQDQLLSVDIVALGRGWAIVHDDQVLARCRGLESLAPAVRSALTHVVGRRADAFCALRASAIEHSGGALLLCGPLAKETVGLRAANGQGALSDGVVFLRGVPAEVLPLGAATAVDEQCWQQDQPPPHRYDTGERVGYIGTPAVGAVGLRGAILLARGEANVEPVDAIELLAALVPERTIGGRGLRCEEFAQLEQALRAVPCQRLVAANAHVAWSMLEEI